MCESLPGICPSGAAARLYHPANDDQRRFVRISTQAAQAVWISSLMVILVHCFIMRWNLQAPATRSACNWTHDRGFVLEGVRCENFPLKALSWCPPRDITARTTTPLVAIKDVYNRDFCWTSRLWVATASPQLIWWRCICFSDNKSMFSKFKMAASAILNLGKYALLMKRLRSMSDSQPPSWNFINMHFRCNSWVQCQIFNIPTKFGDDWSNTNEMWSIF